MIRIKGYVIITNFLDEAYESGDTSGEHLITPKAVAIFKKNRFIIIH